MNVQERPGLMRRLKGFMLKHMHGMITCREFEDFVMSYLDGTLPDSQARRFRWHLSICRECREYLEAYKRTVEVGKLTLRRADESIPEEVPEDLIQAVLDSRKQ